MGCRSSHNVEIRGTKHNVIRHYPLGECRKCAPSVQAHTFCATWENSCGVTPWEVTKPDIEEDTPAMRKFGTPTKTEFK